MLSLLINLPDDTARLQLFNTQWDFSCGQLEVLQGFDGRQMSEEDYRDFVKQSPRKRGWLKGQIGCLKSHQNAWARIVASGQTHVAIFEDDVHLSVKTPNFLSDLDWVPSDADIVRLEANQNLVKLGPSSGRFEDRDIKLVQSDVWCTGGYIIRRDIADMLLKLPERWLQPVDYLLFSKAESRIAQALKVYQVSPALCVQDRWAPSSAGYKSHIEADVIGRARVTDRIKNAVRPYVGKLVGKSHVRFIDDAPCK